MSVLLDVGDEVAPSAYLRANVQEFREYREEEMRIVEEIAQMAVVAGFTFVLAVDGGKFCAEDQKRPYQRDRTDDQIRLHDAKVFEAEIGLVGVAVCGGGVLAAGEPVGGNKGEGC